jgi:hypothetical protein
MEKPEIVMKSTLPNLGVLNPRVFFHRFLCYFLLKRLNDLQPATDPFCVDYQRLTMHCYGYLGEQDLTRPPGHTTADGFCTPDT